MIETETTKRPPGADQIETLLARSAFYEGLSMILRRPDAKTSKWLAMQEHRRLPELAERLAKGNGPLREAAKRLAGELDSAPVAQWLEEHRRIFGHSVQGMAPPYELEYGEEHEHRQPQELGDIAAFYQAFGLRTAAASHERVDHIVTECEFMQILLYKQACAIDEEVVEGAEVCEAAARQFLKDHIGRWGPAFASRLSRAAPDGALRAVADATFEWLLQDCAQTGVPAGAGHLPLRLPKEADDAGCAGCALRNPETADGPFDPI